jgi:phosphoheptose isomerase
VAGDAMAAMKLSGKSIAVMMAAEDAKTMKITTIRAVTTKLLVKKLLTFMHVMMIVAR